MPQKEKEMDFTKMAQSLVAPRVEVNYTDAEGKTTTREAVILEAEGNLITILDCSKGKWCPRTLRSDRVNYFTLSK